MPLAPPPLPYPYGALKPTIDELTMRIQRVAASYATATSCNAGGDH